ncbi:hypothetical protein [Microcystis aeruginosa]|uniref:Uncharacterized protein n=1 Tax=Microcystis aeruginosa (strain NIES-843 / IAM M-2473) TaxID=449447 RepID=B0JJ84_MICAN|nr:hypothetical protein [Microcystis aeruginosa]BAG05792.1 hypothetical protein MAE_59700 [Microcystis aeruginosa NIES-843]
MINREQLRKNLELFFQQEVNKIIMTVPYAGHLTDKNQVLNEKYYVRHLIETIKRIRLTSQTDALALAYMIDEDYEAARLWGRYTAQEMTHDLLFIKDLRQHGYTEKQVFEIQPFQATEAMIDYLKNKIKEIGSLPAVAYSLFVEWNSDQSSGYVIDKVAEKFSKSFVIGAKAHVKIDENEDHYEMMLDVAHRLIVKYADEEILIDILRKIAEFIAAYFYELYQETVITS